MDTETDKLIDLFSRLLDATKVCLPCVMVCGDVMYICISPLLLCGTHMQVSDRKTCGEREALQTSVNASQLVQSCERLLELVGDIKLDIILHDYQRYLHRHVKQQRMNYIREHESFLRSPEHRQWQSIMRGSATEPQGAEDTGQAMDVDM